MNQLNIRYKDGSHLVGRVIMSLSKTTESDLIPDFIKFVIKNNEINSYAKTVKAVTAWLNTINNKAI